MKIKSITYIYFLFISYSVFAQSPTEKKVIIDSEGWKISGILNIPKSKEKLPLVIFGHTLWSGNKSQYDELASTFAKNGIASLRIDLRGHGESTNKGTIKRLDTNPTYLFDSWKDFAAAHKYAEKLPEIDASKIGVLASSYSGELAALSGRNYKYAKAYIIISSALFSQESTLRIKYSNADWWHIVAKDDTTFAKEVVSYIKKRSSSKITYFEAGGHGPELLKSHKELPQQIIKWFQKNLYKKDYELIEKDLIPEGTAYNKKTNTIYIGSIYKQKILSITPDGKVEDIITKEVFGNMSPIGMEVDEKTNTLWANVAAAPIVNQSKPKEWKTTIMAFNLKTNKLIKQYNYINSKQGFLNDITVTNKGEVYATESVSGKIYKIDMKRNKLDKFVDLKGYSFPNGITFYKPKNALFASTSEGILKIDIRTKKITLLEVENDINAKVIDGLAIYDNYFIGHQSSKISKFYFNKEMTKIIDVEVLDSGDEFDSSTTGETGHGFYHYIVNSQIKSGVNQKEKTIKPLDSLENVVIRKLKL